MTALGSGSLWVALCLVTAALPLCAQASSMWREGFDAYTEGNYEEASRIYNEARRDLPESSDLAFNLGCVAYRQGHYNEARAFFEEALASGDAGLRSGAWYNLGNAQARLGQLQQSVASYQNALSLDPDQEDCQYNLEWVLRKLEQQENEAASEREETEDSPSPGTTSPEDPEAEQGDTDGNAGDAAQSLENTAPQTPDGEGAQDEHPGEDEHQVPPQEQSDDGTAETLTEEEAERLLNRIEDRQRGQRRRIEYLRTAPGDRDW